MRDELRERLARLDPMPGGVPTETVTTDSSRQLLEDIISTEVKARNSTDPKKTRWAAVAAAVVVAVGVATAFLLGGGQQAVPLSLAASDPGITGSCMQFSVEQLVTADIAFEGTATSVEGSTVELAVDRWFKGGEADRVVLEAPTGLELLIDGIAFEAGSSYLVSATDGSVNYCGFSGVADTQLRSAFEEAFGG